jgi:PAS domain S-box-containing protein
MIAPPADDRVREIERLNRLYSALSRVNQAIVMCHDEDQLLHTVCRVLVECGGFSIAWIGWHDAATHRIVPAAEWGDRDGFVRDVRIYTDDRPEGQGPSGVAFREARAYVANDVASDPRTGLWRAEAERHGIRSMAVLPIRRAGVVCATLSVYASERGFFQEKELALLGEAAADLSFGLDNFARDRGRAEAEAAAGRDRHLVDTIVESVPGVLYLYDESGRFLRWNRNLLAVTGYTDVELARMGPLDFFRGDDVARVRAGIERVFAGGDVALEAELVARDGRATPYYLTGRRATFDGRPCLVGMGVDIAARVRAERDLRRSEERFHSTLDRMLEGCQLIGFDWRYLYLNDAAAAHGRRSVADLLGRALPECYPDFERTEAFAQLRRCMEERVPVHYEMEFEHPEGGRTWFDVRAQPVPEGIFVLSIDVSDRVAADRALLEAKAALEDKTAQLERERTRLAEAQAVAHVGSWETDLATLVVSWSDETHRIFETDPATFQPTHQAFLERVHPDDRERLDAAFVASAGTEEDQALDHRICMPDGREKVVQERWRVIRDVDGTPVRATGTCQDITARTRADETLRESEERFRQVAETISEVFWITDPDKQQMLYVSPAFESIWGRTVETVYERPASWLDAVHPEDRAQVRQALPGQRRGEYDVVYRIVRPDGSQRWVRDRAFPVRDAAGTVQRVVGLAEDITERKAIEAQFLRAQRLESIGTLAGGIAHDLNNVLTPILMSVELLKEDPSPEGRASTLAAVEASARKGAEMVRQVLSFARGVEGRRAEVDVAQLVREIARIADDTFLKTIHVRTEVPDDPPTVVGDMTQLHQVLLNLCVNARDAMPAGGTITIGVARRDVDERAADAHAGAPPGPYVAISVADTGTGMAPGVLERVFEPFFSTKDPGRGTGLGLSTSLAIVKSHGGFFHVDSEPGRGSTFVVYLPAGGTAVRETAAFGAAGLRRGRGELILVADDEARIREVTRKMLEAFGYRTVLAADGAEALALYERHRGEIAAVLTDMMMPVLDGAATIRALREIDPGVRVIAVTGLSRGADTTSDAAPAARTRRLSKPYTTEELLRVLDSLLRQA